MTLWQWILVYWVCAALVSVIAALLADKDVEYGFLAGLIAIAPTAPLLIFVFLLSSYLEKKKEKNRTVEEQNVSDDDRKLRTEIGLAAEDISNDLDAVEAERISLDLHTAVKRRITRLGARIQDFNENFFVEDADEGKDLPTTFHTVYSNTLSFEFLRSRIFGDERDEILDLGAIQAEQSAPRVMFRRVDLSQEERGNKWILVFPGSFKKSLRKLNSEIKNRAEEAIQALVQDPMSPRGDTIKPLSNNNAGLWRYRIGDYRLVYMPIPDDRHIIFLKVDHRSDAYN